MKRAPELPHFLQVVVLPLLHHLVHQHLHHALGILVVHQVLQFLHPQLDVLHTVHTNCLEAAVFFPAKPIPALSQTTPAPHTLPIPPQAVPMFLMTRPSI